MEEKIKALKAEIKESRELYKKVKGYAMREYLDTIDFPYDIKQRLQGISRNTTRLKEELKQAQK